MTNEELDLFFDFIIDYCNLDLRSMEECKSELRGICEQIDRLRINEVLRKAREKVNANRSD